jgi:hypothetical protein
MEKEDRLEHKGLTYFEVMGEVSLTHDGIDAVEQLLARDESLLGKTRKRAVGVLKASAPLLMELARAWLKKECGL